MVSKTHTMPLGGSKNEISKIIETGFSPKQKLITFFSVISTKPVEIVFEQTIDNIKEVNRNHVMP